MAKKTNFSKLAMRDIASLDSKGDARGKRIRPSIAGRADLIQDTDLDGVVGGATIPVVSGGTAGGVGPRPPVLPPIKE